MLRAKHNVWESLMEKQRPHNKVWNIRQPVKGSWVCTIQYQNREPLPVVGIKGIRQAETAFGESQKVSYDEVQIKTNQNRQPER